MATYRIKLHTAEKSIIDMIQYGGDKGYMTVIGVDSAFQVKHTPSPPASQQVTPRSSISSLPPKKERKTPRIQVSVRLNQAQLKIIVYSYIGKILIHFETAQTYLVVFYKHLI